MAIARGSFVRNTMPSPAGFLAIDNEEVYPEGCTSDPDVPEEFATAMANNAVPDLDEPSLILEAPAVEYGAAGEGNPDSGIEGPDITPE